MRSFVIHRSGLRVQNPVTLQCAVHEKQQTNNKIKKTTFFPIPDSCLNSEFAKIPVMSKTANVYLLEPPCSLKVVCLVRSYLSLNTHKPVQCYKTLRILSNRLEKSQ